MKQNVVFGIDIGGTKISGGIFNSSGNILSRESGFTNAAALMSASGQRVKKLTEFK